MLEITAADVSSWIAENIVEIDGVFYEAAYNDRAHQWYGPLTDRVARLSGCSQWFARSKAGIPSAGGVCWTNRQSLRRAVRRLLTEGAVETPRIRAARDAALSAFFAETEGV